MCVRVLAGEVRVTESEDGRVSVQLFLLTSRHRDRGAFSCWRCRITSLSLHGSRSYDIQGTDGAEVLAEEENSDMDSRGTVCPVTVPEKHFLCFLTLYLLLCRFSAE